jgi:superfamily II DNA or RNA helicase
MSVILPNGIEPFWLARKRNIWKPRTKYFPTRAIASIEPCGRAEMVCIAVDAPDSLYVIEHAVVTHNTTIIAELVRRTVNPKTDRALALAHTQEIVYQLHDRIENQFAELEYWYTVNRQLVPGIGIEMGDHRAASARIVVGTWQTLRSDKRLAELLQHGVITHVFYDEAHHLAADNEGFRLLDALREANPDIRVVGFTATPKRTDNKALAAVFKNICFSYSILDGISSGYLCPAVRKVIRTGIDLSGVKITRGDYAENQLASVLEATNWLDLAFQAYKEHLHDAGRKTLAFFPTVGMSRQFVAKCREAGIGAAHIDATTKRADRLLILRQYQRGDLKVVSNYNILCLDAETEILTSDGWVGMDAMTYEHKVANWDNGRVFFDNPKFIVRRPRKPGERMVVLETPRRSIRVTEDHRMLFKKRYQQDYYIVHAGELVGVEGELPISGYAEPADVAPEQPNMPSARAIAARIRSTAYTYRKNGMDAVTARVEAETAVTARAAMRYKNPSELTADECRLIGFWIGDGTRSELQSGGVEYVFTQSTVYPNIIRWFDGVLERIGLDFRKREVAPHGNVANTTIRWSLPRGTGFGIQKRYGLFPLEPYLNKRGSKLFWGLNAEQFAALIEGFWYADGLHGKAESAPDFYQVSNTNYELLSLLQAIAVCRGFSASITVGTNHLVNPAHKVIYHLRIAHWRGHQMTRHTLHFEDAAWRDEMVWCVTSTTGNIITRRRGTVTVTGNTEGFDAPQTSGILDARPTNSSTVKTQMWGRGLRLSPATGKTDCLILSLAADDTRVLDQGSLLGKMKTCKVCRAEFYYGFRACPACGTPVGTEKQEKEEPETIGSGMVVKPKRGIMEGLVEEISSIFSDTVAAWHKGEDEYLSVGLGFDEGAMVIAPPTWNVDKAERLRERIDRGLYMLNSLPVGDPYRELALEHIDMLRRELLRAENFTLYYVSKKGDVEYVKANSDVTSLIVSSDAEVVARAGGNRYQVDKNAGWRMVQASEAQRNLLSRFGIAATPSMTKGQAAALLTHAMYVRHVKTFIENDVLPEPKTERVA